VSGDGGPTPPDSSPPGDSGDNGLAAEDLRAGASRATASGGEDLRAEDLGAEDLEARDLGEAAPKATGKRRRTVLWATLGVAVVTAALIAVIASAQPSSQVTARSPLLGSAAPSISGPGLAGGHYSLSQFRNEWVLVNFMATWCGPCQQEMPQLLKFAEQHAKSADATVLTVAYDPTNVDQLKAFLAARGARWPAVDDPSASVSYGVTGLPSSFLVAPDGVVYAYVPGEVEAAALDNWLRQGAAKGLGRA
jgi:thiol-disulfide isomerase/thioredoxin